ncbi:unnamed protein product [Bursaphelenchus okinawaensis]|uniref:Nanos-type domain-containing protein n=1 Tax=Bursaphelenchus okinawaensis TaxID=465554 RepID=A0A811K1J4_9BILA|nr:unnamed protein product [Bursaphelenchus okinawaensis]CAG9089812.1 unnamed protein product [Bursaphelenchus okinawaensis]
MNMTPYYPPPAVTAGTPVYAPDIQQQVFIPPQNVMHPQLMSQQSVPPTQSAFYPQNVRPPVMVPQQSRFPHHYVVQHAQPPPNAAGFRPQNRRYSQQIYSRTLSESKLNQTPSMNGQCSPDQPPPPGTAPPFHPPLQPGMAGMPEDMPMYQPQYQQGVVYMDQQPVEQEMFYPQTQFRPPPVPNQIYTPQQYQFQPPPQQYGMPPQQFQRPVNVNPYQQPFQPYQNRQAQSNSPHPSQLSHTEEPAGRPANVSETVVTDQEDYTPPEADAEAELTQQLEETKLDEKEEEEDINNVAGKEFVNSNYQNKNWKPRGQLEEIREEQRPQQRQTQSPFVPDPNAAVFDPRGSERFQNPPVFGSGQHFRNGNVPNQGFRSENMMNQGFRSENQGFRSDNPGFRGENQPAQGFRNENQPNQGFRNEYQTFRSDNQQNQGFRSDNPREFRQENKHSQHDNRQFGNGDKNQFRSYVKNQFRSDNQFRPNFSNDGRNDKRQDQRHLNDRKLERKVSTTSTTSNYSRREDHWRRGNEPKQPEVVECTLCKSQEKPVTVYATHVLRDHQNVKTKCPELQKMTCTECNATGEDAHVKYFCPQFADKKAFNLPKTAEKVRDYIKDRDAKKAQEEQQQQRGQQRNDRQPQNQRQHEQRVYNNSRRNDNQGGNRFRDSYREGGYANRDYGNKEGYGRQDGRKDSQGYRQGGGGGGYGHKRQEGQRYNKN